MYKFELLQVQLNYGSVIQYDSNLEQHLYVKKV